MDITCGKAVTFCRHYPEGVIEPLECELCKEINEDAAIFTVVDVVENSISFANISHNKNEI